MPIFLRVLNIFTTLPKAHVAELVKASTPKYSLESLFLIVPNVHYFRLFGVDFHHPRITPGGQNVKLLLCFLFVRSYQDDVVSIHEHV